MSTHDDGHGRKAGPNPGSQSDFTNRPSLGQAPGVQTWGNNALNAQQSEVSLMAHGAGRPGQPAGGQRPIFGGGSPVFAQMPTYTPVTRGPDIRPQTPTAAAACLHPLRSEPTRPFPAEPAGRFRVELPEPAIAVSAELSERSPGRSAELSEPSAGRRAELSKLPSGGRTRATRATPSYQAAEFSPQSYQPANQPVRAPSYPGAEHAGSQAYPASSYNGAQGFSEPALWRSELRRCELRRVRRGRCELPRVELRPEFRRSNLPIRISPSRASPMRASPSRRASTPASPSTSFPAAHDFGHQDQRAPDNYAQPEIHSQSFDSFADEAGQDYGQVPAERPAAAVAGVRRHLRPAAPDFAGVERSGAPRRPGFL